jgi:RNA polymerase sigma factor (sigma-70 family)
MDQQDRDDWQRFRHGDGISLQRIYHRHKDRLYSYCLFVTGNRELSEDIVQETFLKLAEQTQRLDNDVSIKDWLFICARNLTLNNIKKHQRRTVLLSKIDDFKAELDMETKLFIQDVLDKLDHDERELILLREQQRYPVTEIAKMLGISEEAVRVRLYRVRKKMQQIVREKI